MRVNIHNQCSYFKLTYRESFGEGALCNDDSDEDVDTGSMKSVDLIPFRVAFTGALMYELERKHVKTGSRSEPTLILLFIAWKSEGYKKFRVFVHLIEYDKRSYLHKITSEEYYQRYASQLCTYTDPIKDMWFIYDGTVLMTRLELDFTQRDGVLGVTISEGVEDAHTKRPEWIDLER
jgi:hypothetical protein